MITTIHSEVLGSLTWFRRGACPLGHLKMCEKRGNARRQTGAGRACAGYDGDIDAHPREGSLFVRSERKVTADLGGGTVAVRGIYGGRWRYAETLKFQRSPEKLYNSTTLAVGPRGGAR
ncbi:hypothetical protein C8Q79DRAFT_577516 [Trametes meyenii]|nr:hypothetical protein C8Q79DRAFT_577516 [Trametes meyenii]